ncbi:hypothetical protein ACFZBU_04075 [Embleya sp. NPDC008237]|uniref:hypothetical protein n=1 Tax=Embleya sp. NPDC008237 TaxID=3363978 RepID=UPI0036E5F6DF
MTPVTGNDEDDEFDLGTRMALGGLIGALFDDGEAAPDRRSPEPTSPEETDPTTRETRDL